jgi:hypothetical protein
MRQRMSAARLRTAFSGRYLVLMLSARIDSDRLSQKNRRRFSLLDEAMIVQAFARHGQQQIRQHPQQKPGARLR